MRERHFVRGRRIHSETKRYTDRWREREGVLCHNHVFKTKKIVIEHFRLIHAGSKDSERRTQLTCARSKESKWAQTCRITYASSTEPQALTGN